MKHAPVKVDLYSLLKFLISRRRVGRRLVEAGEKGRWSPRWILSSLHPDRPFGGTMGGALSCRRLGGSRGGCMPPTFGLWASHATIHPNSELLVRTDARTKQVERNPSTIASRA
jgi:hypothetical protein